MLRALRTADSDRSSISGADDEAEEETAAAAAITGAEDGSADIVEEDELISD
jgi:hypothetical protein